MERRHYRLAFAQIDSMIFDYENFHEVPAETTGTFGIGNEPLYNFSAYALRIFSLFGISVPYCRATASFYAALQTNEAPLTLKTTQYKTAAPLNRCAPAKANAIAPAS